MYGTCTHGTAVQVSPLHIKSLSRKLKQSQYFFQAANSFIHSSHTVFRSFLFLITVVPLEDLVEELRHVLLVQLLVVLAHLQQLRPLAHREQLLLRHSGRGLLRQVLSCLDIAGRGPSVGIRSSPPVGLGRFGFQIQGYWLLDLGSVPRRRCDVPHFGLAAGAHRALLAGHLALELVHHFVRNLLLLLGGARADSLDLLEEVGHGLAAALLSLPYLGVFENEIRLLAHPRVRAGLLGFVGDGLTQPLAHLGLDDIPAAAVGEVASESEPAPRLVVRVQHFKL